MGADQTVTDSDPSHYTGAVPGIAYLSGGQSDELATAHLSRMNEIGGFPWKMTFSYGRALQAAPQKAWSCRRENTARYFRGV